MSPGPREDGGLPLTSTSASGNCAQPVAGFSVAVKSSRPGPRELKAYVSPWPWRIAHSSTLLAVSGPPFSPTSPSAVPWTPTSRPPASCIRNVPRPVAFMDILPG